MLDDTEIGLLWLEIKPPAVIHIVLHIPWQLQNIRLPQVVKEAAIKMIKKRLASRFLEFSEDFAGYSIGLSIYYNTRNFGSYKGSGHRCNMLGGC